MLGVYTPNALYVDRSNSSSNNSISSVLAGFGVSPVITSGESWIRPSHLKWSGRRSATTKECNATGKKRKHAPAYLPSRERETAISKIDGAPCGNTIFPE